MSRTDGFLHRVRHGRMLKHGLTWWSALLVLAIVVSGYVALGALLRRQATSYDLGIAVTDRALTPTDDGCELVWRIRVSNPNQRRVSLVSFRFDELEESTRRILGSIDPAGSLERDYRLPLDDCADAPSGARTPLTTTFRLTGSGRERTVSVLIE